MGANQAIVVVSGSQAGAWAAKTLRQKGFQGHSVPLGWEGQIAGAVGIKAGRDIRLLNRLLDSGRPIDAQALVKFGRPLQEVFNS